MKPLRVTERYTVRLGPDGKFELPADFREDFELQPGDQLSLVRVDGYWIISARPLIVPEMADKIAELRERAGLTVADLIAGLEAVGQQLYEEQYGQLVPT